MDVAKESRVFWEIETEVRAGEAAIALIKDDELMEQHVVSPADRRKSTYLPVSDERAELMIRNGSRHMKSEIFLHAVRLVRNLHVSKVEGGLLLSQRRAM
jgi:hypothetical protein